MARKFRELLDRMPVESQARVERDAKALIEEIRLGQLREAREMTQQHLAAELGVAQSEISKIEKRTDMYVSTLAGYVKALGGELSIQVEFPDGKVVKITQFEDAA